MGKVTATIDGHDKVVVKRPRRITNTAFADAIGDAVAQTCNILYPSPDDKLFHPVLGVGGFNWDHENQRTVVRETSTPRVDIQPGKVGSFLLHLRQMWGGVLGFGKGLRSGVDSTGRDE